MPRPSGTKFTCIVVIKIFTINLPSQLCNGRHFGFHIFFHHSLFGGHTVFLQFGCFGLDITSFCICIPQRPALGLSLPQEEEKDLKQIFNTLTTVEPQLSKLLGTRGAP